MTKLSKKLLFTPLLLAVNILFPCITFLFASEAKSIYDVLPTETEILPWKQNGSPALYNKEKLYEYINGGADIFLEYGFNQIVTQNYLFEDKELVVDVYEMQDPESAFGIYSLYRDYNKPVLNVGDDGTRFKYQLVFWQDKYYIVLMGYETDEITQKALLAMAHHVSQRIGVKSQTPPLLNKLPGQNQVPRSQGYVKGVLGLNTRFFLDQKNILEIDGQNVKAVFATYKSNEEQVHLFLISYPDDNHARQKHHLLTNIFAKKYQKNATSFFGDNKNRYYDTVTKGNYVYILYKASDVHLIDVIKRQIYENLHPEYKK